MQFAIDDVAYVRAGEVDGDNPDEGDLYVDPSTGDLRAISDIEAEVQAIQVRLRTWRGEWSLDPSAGLPYVESILGVKGVTESFLRRVFATEVLSRGTVDVVECSVEANRATRSYGLTFQGKFKTGDSFVPFTVSVTP